MRSLLILSTLAIFAAPALGQVTPVCYGQGQCTLSVYLEDTPTTSVDECNDICQSIDFCQDWTLYIDEELCYSFADCAEFDTDCENCYSGTRTCDDLPCNEPGKCEGGRTVDQDVIDSADECLEWCQATEGCMYYTYDSDDDACVLLDGCPDVFTDDCSTCVYGHMLCEGGSGSGTTTATESTTQAGTTLGPVFVTATVLDATDGEPIDGVEVTVTVVSTGEETTAMTDSSGIASLGEFNVGSLVEVVATKSGYADYDRRRTIPANGQLTINMSPEILPGEFRAVMSWGPQPNDLDLHDLIFNRDGSIECEVYYSDKTCGNVFLDYDNQDGGDAGPETITWTAPDNFIHMVYVYDYTGGSVNLYESGAHVTFYGPENENVEPTIDVDVPTDDTSGQRYWVVACIDGAIGYSSINILNYLTDERPDTICEPYYP